MIKLIACDLDGTLLLDGAQKLRPETPELIRELLRQGRTFVAASGRQYANLRRLFAPIRDDITYICENGALVVHRGETLFRHEIPRAEGQQILRAIMAKDGAEALLSGKDTCYIQPKNPQYAIHMRDVVGNAVTVVDDILATTEPYLKIAICETGGVEEALPYWQERFADEVRVVTSGNIWIDVMPTGIHKGSAIRILGEKLGISPDQMMAVGDNYNDREMLEQVTYSVAMKSGRSGIRKICRYETEQVEHLLTEIVEGKYD